MNFKVYNKKQFTVKLTAIFFAAVLFIASLTTIFLDPFQWFKKSENQIEIDLPPITDEKGNEIDQDQVHPMPSRMSFSAQALADSPTGIVATIQATVLPESAENKKVDWVVDWADNQTGTVTDFIKVEPISDGSATAKVTCLRQFTGEIVIIVVTREGGFSAMCFVSFVGIPTSLRVSSNMVSPITGTIGSYYSLGNGNSYAFNINALNTVGGVGAACSYTATISAYGSINVQDRKFNGNLNTNTWLPGTEKILQLSDLKRVSTNIDKYFFECNITKNILTVSIFGAVPSYYTSSSRSGQVATYFENFKSFVDDSWYFKVTITETNSGISTEFKLRPTQTVSGVIFDDSTLVF